MPWPEPPDLRMPFKLVREPRRRGKHSGENGGSNADACGEKQDTPVEGYFAAGRQLYRVGCAKPAKKREGKKDPAGCADQGEQKSFSEHLAEQTGAA